jgi:hypothetical protein
MSNGKCRLTICAGVIALAACQSATEQQPSEAAPTVASRQTAPAIHVTGHGTDPGNASICEGFRLTDAQAREFFVKAQAVTAEQIHDDYDVLPCWAAGTTRNGAETTTWKIRAGGTAEVTAANGDVTYFGCRTCDDIFQ